MEDDKLSYIQSRVSRLMEFVLVFYGQLEPDDVTERSFCEKIIALARGDFSNLSEDCIRGIYRSLLEKNATFIDGETLVDIITADTLFEQSIVLDMRLQSNEVQKTLNSLAKVLNKIRSADIQCVAAMFDELINIIETIQCLDIQYIQKVVQAFPKEFQSLAEFVLDNREFYERVYGDFEAFSQKLSHVLLGKLHQLLRNILNSLSFSSNDSLGNIVDNVMQFHQIISQMQSERKIHHLHAFYAEYCKMYEGLLRYNQEYKNEIIEHFLYELSCILYEYRSPVNSEISQADIQVCTEDDGSFWTINSLLQSSYDSSSQIIVDQKIIDTIQSHEYILELISQEKIYHIDVDISHCKKLVNELFRLDHIHIIYMYMLHNYELLFELAEYLDYNSENKDIAGQLYYLLDLVDLGEEALAELWHCQQYKLYGHDGKQTLFPSFRSYVFDSHDIESHYSPRNKFSTHWTFAKGFSAFVRQNDEIDQKINTYLKGTDVDSPSMSVDKMSEDFRYMMLAYIQLKKLCCDYAFGNYEGFYPITPKKLFFLAAFVDELNHLPQDELYFQFIQREEVFLNFLQDNFHESPKSRSYLPPSHHPYNLDVLKTSVSNALQEYLLYQKIPDVIQEQILNLGMVSAEDTDDILNEIFIALEKILFDWDIESMRNYIGHLQSELKACITKLITKASPKKLFEIIPLIYFVLGQIRDAQKTQHGTKLLRRDVSKIDFDEDEILNGLYYLKKVKNQSFFDHLKKFLLIRQGVSLNYILFVEHDDIVDAFQQFLDAVDLSNIDHTSNDAEHIQDFFQRISIILKQALDHKHDSRLVRLLNQCKSVSIL